MVKTTRHRPARTPLLQKTFVWTAGVSFVLQLLQSIYDFTQYPPGQQDPGMFISVFMGTAILVFVWFVLYLSRRDQALSYQTVFDVTLVTLSVAMIMLALGWLTTFLQLPYARLLGTTSSFMVLYISLPLIATIPPLVIIIRRLRRAHQW